MIRIGENFIHGGPVASAEVAQARGSAEKSGTAYFFRSRAEYLAHLIMAQAPWDVSAIGVPLEFAQHRALDAARYIVGAERSKALTERKRIDIEDGSDDAQA